MLTVSNQDDLNISFGLNKPETGFFLPLGL